MSDQETSRELQPPAHFLFFVSALIAVGPLSMDAYLPALPSIAGDFRVSVTEVSITVSTYLLGYAVGQFFGGPLSDQVGRKAIGITGLTLFVLASIGILQTVSLSHLLLWRFFQALGGGFATIISMALIRDIYSPIEAGKRFATVMMVMMLAPLLAPALGTVLLSFGWHAIFWLFVFYALGLFAVLLTSIPETHPAPAKRISLVSVVHQYREIITHRSDGRWVAMRFPLAMAFSGSVLMVFVTHAAFIYLHHFQMGERWFPLLFGANVVALILTNFLSKKLLNRRHPQPLFRVGMAILLLMASCLFIGTLLAPQSLAVILPLTMLTVGSIGLIHPAGMTLYMSHYPRTGGSAAAAFTTLMFGLGGLLGALPNLFPDHGLLPIVSIILGAALAANLIGHPIPRVVLSDHKP